MQRKLENYRNGLIAEEVALKYLKQRKFNILAHRFKSKIGEIDIIATRQNLVIFCEVKNSDNKENIYYQLKSKQQRRIINTAQFWLSQNPVYHDYDMRFDCILVVGIEIIEHIENAWMSDI